MPHLRRQQRNPEVKVMESDKYGFPAADVEKATEEARLILVRTAKAKMTIAYSELAEQVQAIPLQPHSAAMDGILGDLSEEEDTYGRGMISVIVVHKEWDKRPGKGFFDLAKKLGYDTSDKELLWIQQLRKVHAYWGRPGRSRMQ